ncbi:hypothetical protein [Streptomyces sp. NPDC088789]|uniref:hypothetical protein n=1 Tax=Streptomyces sp. NPDC088789 TaxID=3365899 RepID=UPI0037F54D7E
MTPPDPGASPFFEVSVPEPPTPVERLLALAALYTRHNDRIDLLFSGRAHPDADAYAASARRLERETLACLKAIRQQRLPPIGLIPSTIVRLKQIAHLTGGAARYLTAAQQALPTEDAKSYRPDRRRGFGQYVDLARDLTALASPAIVESAGHIDRRLRGSARTTTVTGIGAPERDVLLQVARGHVIAAGQGERLYRHAVSVDIETLHSLQALHLVTPEPASAPPLFPGGPTRDRIHLTTLGISALSTVINTPDPKPTRSPPLPAPAPGAAGITRTRR